MDAYWDGDRARAEDDMRRVLSHRKHRKHVDMLKHAMVLALVRERSQQSIDRHLARDLFHAGTYCNTRALTTLRRVSALSNHRKQHSHTSNFGTLIHTRYTRKRARAALSCIVSLTRTLLLLTNVICHVHV